MGLGPARNRKSGLGRLVLEEKDPEDDQDADGNDGGHRAADDPCCEFQHKAGYDESDDGQDGQSDEGDYGIHDSVLLSLGAVSIDAGTTAPLQRNWAVQSKGAVTFDDDTTAPLGQNRAV